MMSLIIRYLSGSSPITGLTLSATGLYFFFRSFFAAIGTVVYVGIDLLLPLLEGEPKWTGGYHFYDKTQAFACSTSCIMLSGLMKCAVS